jgi:AcrR family transcriptional regulator
VQTQISTKKKIIEEARKLFAERGYSAATTAEIARRVGVSEAALYKHFKSKKEMILACLTPTDYVKVDIDVENPAESIRQLIKARVKLIRSNLDSFNILYRESPNHPEIAKMFLEQIYTQDKSMEQLMKTSNHDIPPVQSLLYELGITSAIWSILNFEQLQDQVISEKLHLDHMADELADILLYGILGKKDM